MGYIMKYTESLKNPLSESPVICGKCGSIVTAIRLNNPIALCEYDRNNDIQREFSFNHCGRSWLMDPNNPPPNDSIDEGPENINI